MALDETPRKKLLLHKGGKENPFFEKIYHEGELLSAGREDRKGSPGNV